MSALVAFFYAYGAKQYYRNVIKQVSGEVFYITATSNSYGYIENYCLLHFSSHLHIKY